MCRSVEIGFYALYIGRCLFTDSQPNNDATGSGPEFVTNASMAGCGLPLYAEGTVVGGIGVSGGLTPDEHQECADKGAESLGEIMLF